MLLRIVFHSLVYLVQFDFASREVSWRMSSTSLQSVIIVATQDDNNNNYRPIRSRRRRDNSDVDVHRDNHRHCEGLYEDSQLMTRSRRQLVDRLTALRAELSEERRRRKSIRAYLDHVRTERDQLRCEIDQRSRQDAIALRRDVAEMRAAIDALTQV